MNDPTAPKLDFPTNNIPSDGSPNNRQLAELLDDRSHGIICIAGMHRSGTSLVANMLRRCGLYLGEEQEMMPANAFNQDGYWEFFPFVRVNDEILNLVGAGWDKPPVSSKAFEDNDRLRPLAVEVRALQQRFFSRSCWGWKDPRNSLTFPFWQELWPDLKTVICLRNPLEVAVSLRQRGASSYAFGLTLWMEYNRKLLQATQPTRRIVTHYASYFHDPKPELRRLVNFLGLSCPEETIEDCCTAIKSRHYHNRFKTQNLLDFGVSPDILQMYLLLCEEAGWREPADSLALAAPEVDPESRSGSIHADAKLVDLELSRRELEALRSRLVSSDGTIADLRSQLKDQELSRQEVETLRSRLVTSEGTITDLCSQLKDMELSRQEVETLRSRLVCGDGTIADLRSQLKNLELSRHELDDLRSRLVNSDGTVAELRSQLKTETELADWAKGECAERNKTVESLHAALQQKEANQAELKRQVEALARGIESISKRLTDAEYRDLVRSVRKAVHDLVPPGSIVLIASKGDEALLDLDGRTAWHFPQSDGGGYTGYHPEDSAEAIGHLETLRVKGAEYLVFPLTAFWWLEYYAEFRRHVEEHFTRVKACTDPCLIYALHPKHPVGDKVKSLGAGRRRKRGALALKR